MRATIKSFTLPLIYSPSRTNQNWEELPKLQNQPYWTPVNPQNLPQFMIMLELSFLALFSTFVSAATPSSISLCSVAPISTMQKNVNLALHWILGHSCGYIIFEDPSSGGFNFERALYKFTVFNEDFILSLLRGPCHDNYLGDFRVSFFKKRFDECEALVMKKFNWTAESEVLIFEYLRAIDPCLREVEKNFILDSSICIRPEAFKTEACSPSMPSSLAMLLSPFFSTKEYDPSEFQKPLLKIYLESLFFSDDGSINGIEAGKKAIDETLGQIIDALIVREVSAAQGLKLGDLNGLPNLVIKDKRFYFLPQIFSRILRTPHPELKSIVQRILAAPEVKGKMDEKGIIGLLDKEKPDELDTSGILDGLPAFHVDAVVEERMAALWGDPLAFVVYLASLPSETRHADYTNRMLSPETIEISNSKPLPDAAKQNEEKHELDPRLKIGMAVLGISVCAGTIAGIITFLRIKRKNQIV